MLLKVVHILYSLFTMQWIMGVIQFGCCFSKTICREIVSLASLEKHKNEISEHWQKRTNDGLRGEVFDELQTINLKNVGPMSQD